MSEEEGDLTDGVASTLESSTFQYVVTTHV